jgi:hypothetical protein
MFHIWAWRKPQATVAIIKSLAKSVALSHFGLIRGEVASDRMIEAARLGQPGHNVRTRAFMDAADGFVQEMNA